MAKKGRKGKADRPVRGSVATPAQRDPFDAEAGEVAPAEVGASAHDAGAEPPAIRGWSNALIAAFLLLQLALPLRYYLGGGGYDERFSWRMFSTLRMQQCKVKVRETIGDDTRAVDLQKALQIAWIGMLERYRRPVVDKLLARRCAAEGAREVHYERRCVDTDGSALPTTHVRMDCASGKLAVEGEQESAVREQAGVER